MRRYFLLLGLTVGGLLLAGNWQTGRAQDPGSSGSSGLAPINPNFNRAGYGIFGGGTGFGSRPATLNRGLGGFGSSSYSNLFSQSGARSGGVQSFSRPTLSPYLNLLRPGNVAVNYYGLVKPQLQMEAQATANSNRLAQLEDLAQTRSRVTSGTNASDLDIAALLKLEKELDAKRKTQSPQDQQPNDIRLYRDWASPTGQAVPDEVLKNDRPSTTSPSSSGLDAATRQRLKELEDRIRGVSQGSGTTSSTSQNATLPQYRNYSHYYPMARQ